MSTVSVLSEQTSSVEKAIDITCINTAQKNRLLKLLAQDLYFNPVQIA